MVRILQEYLHLWDCHGLCVVYTRPVHSCYLLEAESSVAICPLDFLSPLKSSQACQPWNLDILTSRTSRTVLWAADQQQWSDVQLLEKPLYNQADPLQATHLDCKGTCQYSPNVNVRVRTSSKSQKPRRKSWDSTCVPFYENGIHGMYWISMLNLTVHTKILCSIHKSSIGLDVAWLGWHACLASLQRQHQWSPDGSNGSCLILTPSNSLSHSISRHESGQWYHTSV